MTDFKALRDEIQGILSSSAGNGGRPARGLYATRSEFEHILAALDLADKASGYREALDEDWLEETITDSLDMDWHPRDAARLIIERLKERNGADVAWLIERRVTPPQWAVEQSPTSVGAFYSDVHRAHKFPDKASAECAMSRMAITPEERGQYFVSEHVFVNSQALQGDDNGQG